MIPTIITAEAEAIPLRGLSSSVAERLPVPIPEVEALPIIPAPEREC